MLFKIFLTLLLSQTIQCSLVIDSTIQKGINYSEYCPKMGYCAEGAHVMCMYYNPKSVFGPNCKNPKRNIFVTSEMANKLLDVANAARSRLALGTEKGKYGEPLPRGYGIFRLKWDPELATFAQVLANQCMLRFDLCRATKKFPDPGQASGLVRFTIPDWIPNSKRNTTTKGMGLTNKTLMYATTQTVQFWYTQKKDVTPQMVTTFPNWTGDPAHSRLFGMPYLIMIYGPSTHMGCGVSSYNEYVYMNEATSKNNFNSIQIVCNFSARPRIGGAAYNMVPPSDTASSFNACGCPLGSMADDDCLCHVVPQQREPPLTLLQKSRTCPKGMNCDPTVVLLPIFTVEDAPPDKLITPRRFSNTSLGQMKRLEHGNFEEFDTKKSIQGKHEHTYTGSKDPRQRQASHGKNGISVRIRHFEKNSNQLTDHEDQKQYEDGAHKHVMQSHAQKSSIFAKSPKFELPGSHNFLSSIKKNVIPRRDFSTGKKLVGKYLYGKNGLIPKPAHKFTAEVSDELDKDVHNYLHPKVHDKNTPHEDVHFFDIFTTESNSYTAEHKIIHEKHKIDIIHTTPDYGRLHVKNVTRKQDNKLMALLDTLEQEVKHVELRDKDKEMLDAKIKQIYGKIVGKPGNTVSIKVSKPEDGDDHAHDKILEDVNVANKLDPHDIRKYENNLIDHLTYHSKHDSEPENFGKKHDCNDDISKNSNSYYKDNNRHHNVDDIVDKTGLRRFRLHQISPNQISSSEYDRLRYENEKGRKLSNNRLRNLRKDLENLKHGSKTVDLRYRSNYYAKEPWYDDPLSVERRKFYQEKLDNMERRIQGVRRSNHRKETPNPHMRAMRPSVSDNHMDPLYNSRARFLHGY